MLTFMLLVLSSAPPPLVQAEAPCADEESSTPFFAVTALPGGGVSLDGRNAGFAGSLNLEVRLLSWIGLRAGYELHRAGHAIDFLGVKFSPLAEARWRPYLAASISGDFPSDRGGQSYLGVTPALGLDVALGHGFFLEAEARARFIRANPPQAAAFLGVGFEFL